MKRPSALASAGFLALILTVAGCGAAATAPEGAVTASPIPAGSSARAAGVVIEVSITKSTVTADHSSVHVGMNKPVTLRITAAAAGELHVHSTPEQHIEYPAGTSQVTLSFSVPGTVVIESHALNQQVTQVQVD